MTNANTAKTNAGTNNLFPIFSAESNLNCSLLVLKLPTLTCFVADKTAIAIINTPTIFAGIQSPKIKIIPRIDQNNAVPTFACCSLERRANTDKEIQTKPIIA